MRKVFFLINFITLSLISAAQSTNISGVINTYASVSSINSTTLTVPSSSGFNVGDKVLIIHMQGATIDETDSDAFGDVVDMNDAGNYEFTSVCSVPNGTEIVLTNLTRTYDPAGAVQLINVPVYVDAVVTGTLTASAWDGTIGGVLAVECTGTLTMNSDINLQGMGFRGGVVTTSSYTCSPLDNISGYYYEISTGLGANKGEGIAQYITDKTAGRGAQANGGGGANDHNGGGGGGSNAGVGGQGGDRIPKSMFTCGCTNPGIGGKAITYSNADNKVFMGGGGGAGHENNANTATAGANGGGIVFIKAAELNANGNVINVNGGVISSNSEDGAGGGAGGGSVLLDVLTYSSALTVNAAGSKGGDVFNVGTSNCNGPGGGGGGGLVWVSQSSLPANITVDVTGASSGTTLATDQTNCTLNSANNATAGSNGSTLTDLALVDSDCEGSQTTEYMTICYGDSAYLEGAWQIIAGTYYDDIISACCTTTTETVLTILTEKVGIFNETICAGDSVVINGTTYKNDISGAEEIFTNVGSYNCDSTVTINLTVLPVASTTINETICFGDSIVVNDTIYKTSVANYEYIMTGAAQNGCDSTIIINLTVLEEKTGIVNDTICAGDSIVVNGTVYNSEVTGATEIYNNIGPYGCDSVVTINLMVINLDSTVIQNGAVLTANQFGVNYQWYICGNDTSQITGATNQTYTATENGSYAVEIDLNNCTATSSCYTVIGLGILENTFGNSLKVYPNPTSGQLVIDLGATYDNIILTITTLKGELVKTNTFNSANLLNVELSGSEGYYLLDIKSDEYKAVIKVLKE